MISRKMIIADEFGNRWLVDKSDPSYDSVRRLIQLGFPQSAIVIPQTLILTGALGETDGPMPAWDSNEFLRWCQYQDCIGALRRRSCTT